MSKNIFSSGADEIVEGINKIHITQNTVRFGSDVYQFKNVTGFGMVTSKKQRIPEVVIWLLCPTGIIAVFAGIISTNTDIIYLGVFLLIIAAVLVTYNQVSVTTYGLKLYLPSNEDKIFLSKDREGIKEIVSCLYKFMEKENNPNAVATITIDQRHARIGIGYAENVNSREN